MSNIQYSFSDDIGFGKLSDGTTFLFDTELFEQIRDVNWYRNYNDKAENRRLYITDCRGRKLHTYLIGNTPGLEVDHANTDTLDNRLCNLRICTHQQNQMNQPLQKNNTSGITGVSFYKPRNKFRARIKIQQQEIHLGYYDTFEQAVMARNIGMKCMFGQYGRYNKVPEIPSWIIDKVTEKCKRFADLSVSSYFEFAGKGYGQY